MIIKKINGACAWLLMVALLGHFILMMRTLLFFWYSREICKAFAFATAGLCAVHVLISLIIVMFCHDGTELSHYRKLNTKVIIQRATGLAIIALLHLHVNAFSFITSGEALSSSAPILIVATELAFFAAIFLHISVSFTPSVITMGIIRTDAAEKRLDHITYAVCACMMILAAVAIISFMVRWTGMAG